jgi:hypothetical protein
MIGLTVIGAYGSGVGVAVVVVVVVGGDIAKMRVYIMNALIN